jgi:diacylglycerol kinase (ATP)
MTSIRKRNEKKPFTFSGRARSFGYAGRGIWTMVRSQHNAWIHAGATILVVCAGFALGLESGEWARIVLVIMAVWIAEALNTALEYMADAASPAFHPKIEKAKDVAAGAVLIAATGAAVIGVMTFWPHVTALLGR